MHNEPCLNLSSSDIVIFLPPNYCQQRIIHSTEARHIKMSAVLLHNILSQKKALKMDAGVNGPATML